MKKFLAALLAAAMPLFALAGCGVQAAGFDAGKAITVISREDGSGTRSAFIELVGILVENEDGTEADMTTKEAVITDKTDVMMTNIANDPYAIGYISLGSMNGTIKAVNIDGVQASVDNVKDGSYKIQRPFNIAVKEGLSEAASDFIAFILSKEGQGVIAANNYIAIDESAPAFSGSSPSGTVTVAGSSSVTPVMEELREAYLAVNANAKIEINMSDSSAGMTAAMEGICEIGMASRDLKDSELAQLTGTTIALDGIAVIVHNENTTANLSAEQVKNIFTGAITAWDGIN
ncbi:MAG: substrate-binding domain-containing protein [Clostridiales bacterium]|jgi:phosphate transport system substrate-binding protein|nr:substrate-binding domain-containing protein [Clostridiales bacterium]